MLESVARIGGRLGELRLDTELDISHGVVRYLELLKLAALLQRPAGQELADALADVNARLLAATTPLQREILQTSTLDESLLAAEHAALAAPPIGGRDEHSLRPFLPRKGVGLALSASDIETYRSCPAALQVRARAADPDRADARNSASASSCTRCSSASTAAARRRSRRCSSCSTPAGAARASATSEHEGELLREGARRARRATTSACSGQDCRAGVVRAQLLLPARSPPPARARRPRRPRSAGRTAGEGDAGEYELIDYKTSRPKSAEQLKDDVQLSLYALAAREDWGLESSRQAYYYVLDDLKVPVPRGAQDEASVRELVMEVGEGILAQEFEPTPSHAACSICDYRIVCPVAEK